MQLTTAAGNVFQAFEKLRITALLNLLTNLARTLTVLGMLLILHHATAWQWAVAFNVGLCIGGWCCNDRCHTQVWLAPSLLLSIIVKHGVEGIRVFLCVVNYFSL